MFKKVTIVGVGLIGGSLGLAIKKRKLAGLVVGVVRRESTAQEAMRLKALDVATLDLKEGVSGADLVILCAPVLTIFKHLSQIGKWLKPGALVIDVASSKEEIEKIARRHLKNTRFVGCHPMAGSENRGLKFAKPDLFQDSVCFLSKKNPVVAQFWKGLGALPVVLGACEHDRWVAKASHLPHLLAFSLFQNFSNQPAKNLKRLNPSLRDLARLSKSDAKVWTDIFLSNQRCLLESVGEFEKHLFQFKKALQRKSSSWIEKLILHANQNSTQFTKA